MLHSTACGNTLLDCIGAHLVDQKRSPLDSIYIYGSENHDKILAELEFDQALNSSGRLVYLSLQYLITRNFLDTLFLRIWGGDIS